MVGEGEDAGGGQKKHKAINAYYSEVSQVGA